MQLDIIQIKNKETEIIGKTHNIQTWHADGGATENPVSDLELILSKTAVNALSFSKWAFIFKI